MSDHIIAQAINNASSEICWVLKVIGFILSVIAGTLLVS